MSNPDHTIPMLDLSEEIDALWDDLQTAINRVLRSGQFVLGPDVTAFEQEAAKYLGVKHAIGLNSGTDALIIGLRALGINAGDEVITTPFSFFATAEAIGLIGATPVFVDIHADTFNINAELIEAAITPRTKAILPVHLYGQPATMDAIMHVANKHKLRVLEDCAQSFGATYQHAGSAYHKKFTGSIGHAGAFSFYPTKNLGAYGDAGLLTTNDDTVASMARQLRNHGSSARYQHDMLGYNSRLDSLQAAVLRIKLPFVDAWNAQRRERAARYNALLAGVDGVMTPVVTDSHVFHQYTVRFTNPRVSRDAVKAYLAERGVASSVFYPNAMQRMPMFASNTTLLGVVDEVTQQVLSLPLWATMRNDVQERVVAVLKDAITETSQ